MNIYSLLNIEHLSNFNPLNAQQIEGILNDTISPELKKVGLDNKSKKYIWQSEYNSEGIKKIIQFSYRGTRGNFFVGTNFKFVPFLTQNKNLRYYNYKFQLFEDSEYFDTINTISLWNEKFFVKSLKKYIDKNFRKKVDFLNSLDTLEANIKLAEEQIDSIQFQYKTHHPSPKYIMVYLQEKQGNYAEANKFKELFLKEEGHSNDPIFKNLDKLK